MYSILYSITLFCAPGIIVAEHSKLNWQAYILTHAQLSLHAIVLVLTSAMI